MLINDIAGRSDLAFGTHNSAAAGHPARLRLPQFCWIEATHRVVGKGMTQQVADPVRRVTISCHSCYTPNRVVVERVNSGPKCGNCAKPILLDRPVRLCDEDFNRVIRDAEIPVLVDFHADWCMPSRVMTPVIQQLAEDRAGKVLVAILDTERNPETAQHYEIRNLPTLVLFRDGAEAARHAGAIPRRLIDKMLNGGL